MSTECEKVNFCGGEALGAKVSRKLCAKLVLPLFDAVVLLRKVRVTVVHNFQVMLANRGQVCARLVRQLRPISSSSATPAASSGQTPAKTAPSGQTPTNFDEAPKVCF